MRARPAASVPSFVCVGPEKTGTSWLYANLEPHPDLYLPPVKELRYFYERTAYPGEGWAARFSPGGDWHTRDYRAYARERLRSYRANPAALVRERRRLAWDLRYLFGPRSDAWYRSLFDDAGGRLAGDVSPQYFSLPDDELDHIRALAPALKVIVLLRDPIDWSWSFARMSLIGDRAPDDVADAEYAAFFDEYMAYYPTVPAVERWRARFADGAVHVGFYERLRDAPSEFYAEICAFLGVDAARAPESVRARISRRVNEGRAVPMPDRFAVSLARAWRDEIERLCDAFEPYPQLWLARCDAILAGAAVLRKTPY